MGVKGRDVDPRSKVTTDWDTVSLPAILLSFVLATMESCSATTSSDVSLTTVYMFLLNLGRSFIRPQAWLIHVHPPHTMLWHSRFDVLVTSIIVLTYMSIGMTEALYGSPSQLTHCLTYNNFALVPFHL